MFKKIIILAVLTAGFNSFANAKIITINFETVLGDRGPVPDGYSGLDWDNFNLFSKSDSLLGLERTISTHVAAYADDVGVISSLTPFSLSRLTLGSAGWTADGRTYIDGYLQGQKIYARSFTTYDYVAINAGLDFNGVDRVVFYSKSLSNGTSRLTSIDQLVVDVPLAVAVPEPNQWAMILLGLGMVGWMTKCRRIVPGKWCM